MAQLTIRRTYAANYTPTQSDLDAFVDDIESFFNITKINDDNIQAGGITASSKFEDGSVITAKFQNEAVTTAKITDSSVTTAKIADSNVTTAKIADSNVTTAKIADSNVTTAKINAGAVTQAKLATTDIVSTAINFTQSPTEYFTAPPTTLSNITVVGTSSNMTISNGAVLIILKSNNSYTEGTNWGNPTSMYMAIERSTDGGSTYTEILRQHVDEIYLSSSYYQRVPLIGNLLTLVDFPGTTQVRYKVRFRFYGYSTTGSASFNGDMTLQTMELIR